MNEFELIAGLRQIFDAAAPALRGESFPVPNGDDAAVVRTASGMTTVTTDALVEGVHFSFDLCSHADAGYRSVAVNLSDLAAMGALPVGILVSLVIPDRMGDAAVIEVGRGIAGAAGMFGSPVIGGNITRTDGPFVISITAIGDQLTFPPPLRSGARDGDEIWVSGHVGDGALGLRLLQEWPALQASFPCLVDAWRRPVPRLDLTGILGGPGVSAAIDISDGFVADVGHIADDSSLCARIDVAAIPISDEALAFRSQADVADFMSSVLYGGDDYQLVVTARPSSHGALAAAGLTCVGRMTAGSGVILSGLDGQAAGTIGWMHRRG